MKLILPIMIFSAAASGTPFTTTTIQTTCPFQSTVGVYSSTPVTCDTGNVNGYLEFSGFTNSPSATNYGIQPLANTANQGFYFPDFVQGPFAFEVGFNVQAFNETADSVTFHVTSTAPQNGQATVTMYICSGPAITCMTSPTETVTIGPNPPVVETVNFDPTSSFGVLFVGNIDATSSLTQFEMTIGNNGGGTGGATGGVPEPATKTMAGLGLLLVGLARWRPWGGEKRPHKPIVRLASHRR